MMGESKPNFALDLSNEGVALWHRSSGGGWSTLGSVSLDDPEFSEKFAALREGASKGTGRARRAVVRIPRSEVLLSKVRVGVFEGEAAIRHAHKQIAELSPYEMREIAYDLGDKGAGNMAPVGIITLQTLTEAEAFAKSNGFNPLYFTTQYAEKEFNREPRFYLTQAKPAAKPLWFVSWVAAASIGLAAGYFGYTYLTSPTVSQPTATAAIQEQPEQVDETTAPETAQATPEPEPEPQPVVDTAQLGLQDVAPALPNVAVEISAPDVTQYPEMRVASYALGSDITDPIVTRLRPSQADVPTVFASSKQLKTSDLQIAEARRDLPDVSVNNEIVSIIQSDMAMLTLNSPQPVQAVQLASLTTPNQQLDPVLLTRLPRSIATDIGVDDAAQKPAARPVRPPSPITAAPGTLIPTREGTPGPEYITIFAGRPSNEPRNRADPLPPELELAGFKPRLRPETLSVPAELIAVAEPEVVVEPTILDLADETLRPLRARIRPASLIIPEAEPEVLATVEPEETPIVVQEPTILALADPALRPLRARIRPDALSDRAQTLIEQQQTLALGDQTLRPLRARLRPSTLVVLQTALDTETGPTETDLASNAPETSTDGTTNTSTADISSLVASALATATQDAAAEQNADIIAAIAQDTVIQAIQEEASVLALADPTLRPFRARTRPINLPTPTQVAALTTENTQSDAGQSLLALADPTLSGNRARVRPNTLRIITPEERTSLLSLADPSLSGKRTRVRPRNLRIIAPEPDPVPETEIEVEVEVEEVVEPEIPVIRGTKLAIAVSPKPKVRPRKLARVVQRVTREAKRTNTAVQNDGTNDGRTGISTSGGSTRATAKLPRSAKGTVKSAPPTSTTVARAATEKSRFKKSRMSLVGIFGAPSQRRALIRLPSGRYVKVQNGDKVSGWKISAIGESSLRINKGSRNQTLRIP